MYFNDVLYKAMKRTYGKTLLKEANSAMKKELKKREDEILNRMALK